MPARPTVGKRRTGGGVRWLLEQRPDLLRCDYVLNEGDGAYVPCGDRRLFLLQSGEKGAAQFRIVVHGRAGHGSVPLRQGNAVLAAARVAAALAACELPVEVVDQSRDLVGYLVAGIPTCAPACATPRGRAPPSTSWRIANPAWPP